MGEVFLNVEGDEAGDDRLVNHADESAVSVGLFKLTAADYGDAVLTISGQVEGKPAAIGVSLDDYRVAEVIGKLQAFLDNKRKG